MARANAAVTHAAAPDSDLLANWLTHDEYAMAMAVRKAAGAPVKFCKDHPGSCVERGKLGRGHSWDECFANPKHRDRQAMPAELREKWAKLPQAAKDAADTWRRGCCAVGMRFGRCRVWTGAVHGGALDPASGST